jgi:hypothetical protein
MFRARRQGTNPHCARVIIAGNLIFFVVFIIVATSDAASLSTLFSQFGICPSSKFLKYLVGGGNPKKRFYQ